MFNLEKRDKILIAVPTQEMARAAIFYDYMDILHKPENCDIVTSRAHGQSPARSRNMMIRHAIDAGMDYIFFVDDDCILPPDTLVKLYNHKVDIVTGLYLMRNHPHSPIIFDTALDDGKCSWHNLKPEESGLVEVIAAGLGCCLIKIDVFKKIAETNQYWVTLGELESDHWCDDLSFFKRVRASGFKIFCDVSAPVGHVAKTIIWPDKPNGIWSVVYDTEGQSRVSFPMTPVVSIPHMKAPSDKRPTWRGGVIQVHVTRACDLSCTGCTQGSNLAGKPVMMTTENFEQALISLKDYFGVIGMFGGNPCTHPDFEELCALMKKHVPFQQRGLWSNNLMGYGKLCREIFNPSVSNLNVHGNEAAYHEMKQDWPECDPLGKNHFSRHSPPYVALKDMEDMNDTERWNLIANCDINQYWSAMICTFRGELRAFFCELAGAQSMLHEHEADYPDTGVAVIPGWWTNDIKFFGNQVLKHCMECGIPLRGVGDLDSGNMEFVSKTHESIYKPKRMGRIIYLVRTRSELRGSVGMATSYIGNGLPAELINK